MECYNRIEFRVADINTELTDPELCKRFDVVLDKGTWDAISLSGKENSLKNYKRSVADMLGSQTLQGSSSPVMSKYFIIISCNFTRDELIDFFGDHIFQFFYELSANNSFLFGGRTGVTSTGCVFKVVDGRI